MSEYTKEQIEEAEIRYKTMLAKYHKCLDALEFIAFNDHPAWTNKDRRERAIKTLEEISYIKRVTEPANGEFRRTDPPLKP